MKESSWLERYMQQHMYINSLTSVGFGELLVGMVFWFFEVVKTALLAKSTLKNRLVILIFSITITVQLVRLGV